MAGKLSIRAVQPRGLSFPAWGALMSEQLAAYGVSAPRTEADWKSWVCALFYVPELAAQNIPSPDGFADWRGWAVQFLNSVR